MPCLRLLRRTRLCREAEPLEKPWRGRPSGTDLVLPVPAESSLRFVHSGSETVRMVSSNSSRYLATWQVAASSAERNSTPHVVGMAACTSIALGGNISRLLQSHRVNSVPLVESPRVRHRLDENASTTVAIRGRGLHLGAHSSYPAAGCNMLDNSRLLRKRDLAARGVVISKPTARP